MSFISDNNLVTQPQNVDTEFRESFETYNTTTVWSQTTGTGDIVQLDGNAASASYLVISKNPLTATTETTVTTQASFTGPFETMVGLSMSQRVLGQETSIELVSTDAPIAPIPDIAISSITQSTTTLTVVTATAHGLSVGQRIGIYGVTSDSRFNYPAVVVAAIVSTTSFTVTAGPAGTIASVTAGPYTNQGYVYYRPALGYAQEGMSEVFENSSATNASLYVRSDMGDVLPSGTVAGNQSVTIGTTASVSLATAAYTYAFIPTSEYKFLLQSDKAQFFEAPVDTVNQPTARLNRTSVVPSIEKTYKLRFRCTNDAGLPIPNGKITSASKSGTTTTTITTETAHGLTTGDYVNVYGIGNSTDFPNVTTAVQVLSTPTTTTFTIIIAGAVTATSAGGLVSRQQGSLSLQGIATPVAAQASSTSTELTLIGSASWSLVIGDYVNVYGLRNRATGADLGFDGVYRVANQVTSTLTLIPLTGTTLPAPLTLTSTGGAVIRRTDTRISYARINQYLRERVEILNKSDSYSGIPVQINGGTISTVSGGAIGTQAFPNQLANDITSAALTSTATSAAITPANNSCSFEYNVIVTAVSGTSPTMDVVVQESDDTGTNWYDIYHFPRITATGQYRSPLIPQTGNRVRYVRTIGGTSPSFTNAVNRVQSNSPQPLQRQFVDRALVVNTINSVTAGTWFIDGCKTFTLFVSMGAVTTTAPVLVLEVSPDNANWVQIGADITTAASTNNQLAVTDILSRFARVRVKTAGSGATLNFLVLKGAGL
jgi:hypothetical protein